MDNRFARTARLIGQNGLQTLQNARVAVFGLGGVGSYTVEALCRSGVGALDLIDHDRVDITNLNRQLIATEQTVGMQKTEAARQRLLSINPAARIRVYDLFFLPQTADQIDFSVYDYVVDAVDTVSAKIEIVLRATAVGVPVISCMGAGNKLDATAFYVTDLYKTQMDPLARVMRRELRRRGVQSLKVICSGAAPVSPVAGDAGGGRQPPGSVAYVPGVAGLLAAGEVIGDLLNGREEHL